LKLVKEIKFSNVYVSRYSPRPGTLAYRLEDNVSPEEKKRRKEKIEEVLRNCIRWVHLWQKEISKTKFKYDRILI